MYLHALYEDLVYTSWMYLMFFTGQNHKDVFKTKQKKPFLPKLRLLGLLNNQSSKMRINQRMPIISLLEVVEC